MKWPVLSFLGPYGFEHMAQIIWVSADANGNGTGTAADPYPSIQQAIDAAGPGATINVMAGVYEENVVFKRDQGGTEAEPIMLVSVDGPGAATIVPKDANKDTINIDGADNIVITGFQIHGSDVETEQAIHIHLAGGSDLAENITIDGNVIHRGAGDGIKGSKASNITITDNTILGGGDSESGIDFVGVTTAIIEGNTLTDLNRGIMIKGGSKDIAIIDNTITGSEKQAMEIGGYTDSQYYPPGFLEAGNTYEAFNILVSGNIITDCGGSALRLIGAVQVQISDNHFSDTGAVVRIDDSSKYHETWFSDLIGFARNDGNWELKDRSDRAEIVSNDADLGVFEPWQGLFGAEPQPNPEPQPDPEPEPDPEPDPQPEPVYHVDGTDGDDELSLTDAADTGFGLAGDDTLDGKGGNDTIHGGNGRDELDGGDGSDLLFGDSGDDRILGGDGDDILVGGSDDDDLRGENGQDLLLGEGGNDDIEGGRGDDTLSGGGGDDELPGGKGNDVISGGTGDDDIEGDRGNDTIDGGAGDDTIEGNDGADVIHAGAGNDKLESGDDADTFVFRQGQGFDHDKIEDFEPGEDLIALLGFGNALSSFADIDTNGNGVLDTGDTNVSLSGGDTNLDLSAFYGAAPGSHTILIEDNDLTAEDFAFLL